MILIPLGHGKFVEVDDEDAYAVLQHSWSPDHQYAAAKIKSQKISLHIFIAKRMGIYKKGYDVDHKDRNPDNCKRENLRRATRSQNNRNSVIIKSNTGHRHISYRSGRVGYIVTFEINAYKIYRTFKTIEEAIEFRNSIYEKYGENFYVESD